MKKKIVYIISLVSHSRLFEWTAELLSRDKYELVFILLHGQETPLELFLRNQGFRVYRVNYVSKVNMPRAVIRLHRILRKEKPAIVHTHLFEAGVAGNLAARLARVRTRIHTRHDATIHHEFHPGAVKYDRLTNRLSTKIIAITESVKTILTELEGVSPGKIVIVHHGFRLEEFSSVESQRIVDVQRKYFPDGKKFKVIGVVSRFIEWKGIQYILQAFTQLLREQRNVHLVLANATGPYQEELVRLLSKIPRDRYTIVPFEKDIPALYKSFDIFVHCAINKSAEAFGQVYVEAMAAGIPSVITLSGIVNEFVIHEKHALVVPYSNGEATAAAVGRLLDDRSLATGIAENAREYVVANFGVSRMIQQLEEVYDH